MRRGKTLRKPMAVSEGAVGSGKEMGKKNIGERSCIGCGRKAHKSELLRFVADPEGGLLFDPDQSAPGRGGYFCRKNTCFDRAARKRRLSVRFRRDMRVDPHSVMKSIQVQLGGGSSGWPK